MSSVLISSPELKELLDAETEVKIIDCTQPPPSEEKYKTVALPRALYFRLSKVKEDGLPNTWPLAGRVASRCAQLGVKRTDTIVLYDQPQT